MNFLFVASRRELDLFQNCTDEQALSTYIKETLSSMLNDDRSHRKLAVRHDVHLRYMAPKPLAQAVNSFCMKNGLHKESFLVCLESNINWLEHPRTRLGADIPPDNLTLDDILDLHDDEDDDVNAQSWLAESKKSTAKKPAGKKKAAGKRSALLVYIDSEQALHLSASARIFSLQPKLSLYLRCSGRRRRWHATFTRQKVSCTQACRCSQRSC